ncbi:MAG: cupin domain-containing protein [Chloroflexi bacterium]|nr:cupin domain-containing protein [Chloroflexota bacterium]
MDAFKLEDLLRQHDEHGKLYLEFLRYPSMSMGLYRLPAGGEDSQQPHNEDEVYYIVSGRAKISLAHQVQAVSAGSIVYVAKHIEHHFHDIEEDLTILVFFAPAEYSGQ